MKVVFFKKHTPREFNIKTRFYDPKKEEEEARERRYSGKHEGDSETRLREQMQRRWHRRTDTARKQSTRKTFIYIVIVAILIYLLYIKNVI